MPPNRVPMVSTGSDHQRSGDAGERHGDQHAGPGGTHFRKTDDADGGKRDRNRRCIRRADGAPERASFGMSSPGSFPASVMPSRSWIWLAKMMTAMPAVNPTVTG
jgi:hypothetical protein